MIRKNKVYWVWLSLICRPGGRSAVKILRRFSDAASVYGATAKELLESGTLKESDRIYAEILRHDTSLAEEIVFWCKKSGVKIITPDDDDYPVDLYSLRDAPIALYCVGELPKFEKLCSIAVVGTRSMSDYGRVNAFRMGYGLAKGGAVTVSGLALGVDGTAMASAIEGGGTVVGVLGCGIDVVYPHEHETLFRLSAKNGAVITEYAPGEKPQRNSFPQRNRIISGLCQGTVVIEASSSSGSLITARHALYQGRDLFSVPGRVGDAGAEGTNLLIKEGALAVTGPEDVLERYEYVYPHSIDLSSMRRSLSPIDCVSSSALTCLKYEVATEGDRNSVYSRKKKFTGKYASSVVSAGSSDAGDFTFDDAVPEIPEGANVPKAIPSAKGAAEKRKKKFDSLSESPKRIDFELLSDCDRRVYNAMLPDTPMMPDELILEGMQIKDVTASLTMLEICGAVEAGAGGYFMRTSADDLALEEE